MCRRRVVESNLLIQSPLRKVGLILRNGSIIFLFLPSLFFFLALVDVVHSFSPEITQAYALDKGAQVNLVKRSRSTAVGQCDVSDLPTMVAWLLVSWCYWVLGLTRES